MTIKERISETIQRVFGVEECEICTDKGVKCGECIDGFFLKEQIDVCDDLATDILVAIDDYDDWELADATIEALKERGLWFGHRGDGET